MTTPTTLTSPLPPAEAPGSDPVAALLASTLAYVRTKRRVALLRALARSLIFSLAAILSLALADRYLALSPYTRLASLLFSALIALTLLAHPLWQYLRPCSPVEAADELERDAALRRESLVTLAWHSLRPAPGVSPHMLRLLAHRTSLDLARLGPLPAAAGSARGPWITALVSLLAFSMLFALPSLRLPEALPRILLPLQPRDPLIGPRLRVEPGPASIPQNSRLRILASLEDARGSTPPLPAVTAFVETTRDGQNFSRTEMSRRGTAGFSLELPPIDRTLQYRVKVLASSSDDSTQITSRLYPVEVLTAPAATRLSLDIVEPAPINPAGRIQSTIVIADEPVPVRAGSDLTLRLETTEPIARGSITGPGLSLTFLPDNPNSPSATIRLPRSVTLLASCPLRISFQNPRGAAGSAQLNLTAIPDARPTVRIERPADKSAAGPRDDIDIAIAAEDDIGLSSLALELTLPNNALSRIELPLPESGKSAHLTHRLNLSSLSLSPGDTLRLAAIARDTARQESRSPDISISLSASAPEPLSYSRSAVLRDTADALASASDHLTAARTLLSDSPDDDRTDSARAHLAAASDALLRTQRGILNLARLADTPEQADACESAAERLISPSSSIDALTSDSLTPDSSTLPIIDQARSALDPLASTLSVWLKGEEAAQRLATGNTDPDNELAVRNTANLLRQLQGLNTLTLLQSAAPTDPHTRDIPAGLQAASRVEALRPDSLPLRAADLALLARAAEMYLQRGLDLRELASLAQPLLSLHRELRAHNPVPPELTSAADNARANLEARAAPLGPTVQTLRELASLSNSPQPPPDAPPELKAAAQLLSLAREARDLSRSLTPESSPDPATLLQRQQSLLSRLESAAASSQSNPANPATGSLVAAFRAASEADRQLAQLQATATTLSQAHPAATSPTAKDLTSTFNPDALRDDLRRYVPELAPAARWLDTRLKPLLNDLANTSDPAAARNLAEQLSLTALATRQSIDQARHSMRRRDPLAAAQASLALAHDALTPPANTPPDLDTARRSAQDTAAALEIAAQQTLRPYIQSRLAKLPDLAPLNEAPNSLPTPTPPTTTPPTRSPAPTSPLPNESNLPPEYRDAIRAYFHRLGLTPNTPR